MKKALAVIIGVAVLVALVIVIWPQSSTDTGPAETTAVTPPQKNVPLPPKTARGDKTPAPATPQEEDTGTFPPIQRPIVTEGYKPGDILRAALPDTFRQHCPDLKASLQSASWTTAWMQQFIRTDMGRYIDVARVLEPVFVCESLQKRSPDGCLPLKDVHEELFNECIDEWQLAEYLTRRSGIEQQDAAGVTAALAKENARLGRRDNFLVGYIPAVIRQAAEGTVEGCNKTDDDGVRLACLALVKHDASYCRRMPSPRAKYYCAVTMDTAANGHNGAWDAAAAHPEWSLPLRNLLKYFDLQPGKEQMPPCNQGALDWLNKLCTGDAPY